MAIKTHFNEEQKMFKSQIIQQTASGRCRQKEILYLFNILFQSTEEYWNTLILGQILCHPRFYDEETREISEGTECQKCMVT